MNKLPKPHLLFLLCISLLGAIPVLWGLVQFPVYDSKLLLLMMSLLVVLSQVITTSIPVSERAGITYSIAPVVSLATLPFFGPMAAAIVEAISVISLWLLKPINKVTWKKSGKQLAFNTGMSVIAIVAAGGVFLLLRGWLGSQNVLGVVISWLVAALVYEQVNLWLLLIILRLQHGSSIDILQMWRQNKGATSFNVLVLSLGGGLLASAVQTFDWVGPAIFLLPIILSAYLFHLYTRKKNLVKNL